MRYSVESLRKVDKVIEKVSLVLQMLLHQEPAVEGLLDSASAWSEYIITQLEEKRLRNSK